jgi:serine/threonine protein kinase
MTAYACSRLWLTVDLFGYRKGAYVAVKIGIAERKDESPTRELQTMELASHDPHLKHIVQLLDQFNIKGPNGSHQCLVYELLGPSVPDVADAKFPGGRLPGKLAKAITKQSLIALADLHQLGIGHGGKLRPPGGL